MRVNVYAEELTDKVEIVNKGGFFGLRFWLELPVTKNGEQVAGPFMHHADDNDSSAVTFFGPRKLLPILKDAVAKLEKHLAERDRAAEWEP